MYSNRLEQSAMASGGVRDLKTLGGRWDTGHEGETPQAPAYYHSAGSECDCLPPTNPLSK